MILEAKNISKNYSGHRALQEVSIGVEKGEVFGLLGPNGAGKTTLIRIINQIIRPDSGTVLLNNEAISSSSIPKIGYLPEERGLYKKMTVADQVLYLSSLKGLKNSLAKERLKTWLEKFDMLPWAKKKIEELSKGMQQKVQFIVTVIHEPELLILDEPFSGFDPVNTELVKKEVLNLKKNGTSIIFSTHNMSSVEEVCDSIALINRSKKILGGSVAEVRKSHGGDEFLVTYIGNKIAFVNALWTNFQLVDHKEVNGVAEARVKSLNGCNLNKLAESIIPHVELKAIQEKLPSMHDIFIKVVSQKDQVDE